MLPKKLSIQGLYSYQKKQEIDFNALTSAGLFGIFGQVGSGKSSILEAIGFALYGKTERMGDRGDNRNYNMMNLQSDELLIDFEFENYDGILYRYVVQGKRNRKRFEEVNTLERRVFKWENGAWLPLESADAASVLDLSYDNFRRTIIIPQGKFQEFLQLTGSGRTEMMKEIFKLQKFDLSDNVKRIESDNEIAIAHVNGSLQQLEQYREEILSGKKDQLSEIKLLFDAQNILFQQQEVQLHNMQKLQSDYIALRQAEKKMIDLSAQKISFDAREKRTDRFETAQFNFGALLDHKKITQQRLALRQSQLQSALHEKESIQKESDKIQAQLNMLQKEHEQLDVYRELQQDYTIAEKIIHQKKEIENKKIRVLNADKEIEKVSNKIQDYTAQGIALEHTIAKQKQLLPDAQVLNEVGRWFVTAKALKKSIAEIELDLKQCEIDKAQLVQSFQVLGLSQEDWKQKLQREEEALSAKANECATQLQQMQVRYELQQYAHNLHDGAACPLCGSLEHPSVLTFDDVTAHVEALNRIKKEIESSIKTCHDQRNKAVSLEAQWNGWQVQYQKNVDALQSKKEEWNALIQLFVWPGFSPEDEAAFVSAEQEAKTLQKSIVQNESALKILTESKDKETANLQKYALAKAAFVAENETNLQHVAQLIASLKRLSDKELEGLTEAKASAEAALYKEKIITVQSQFEKLTSDYNQLQRALSVLLGSIENLKNEYLADEKMIADIQIQLDQQLEKYHFQDENEVGQILSQKISLTEERKAINEFHQQLFIAEKELSDCKALVADRVLDETELTELTNSVARLQSGLESQKEQIAILQNEIKHIGENIKIRLELQAKSDALAMRAENIKTMKSLFSSKGFVNYVSSVYLQNLCAAANERFVRLTHNQLQLELNDENDFLVRDFMNDGKVRSVKTLSGGQTFQAALSLALALADSVQSQNKSKQNFFFLDEGFGSLDKNALATVFETLKSLRKENRIVGVISHVEELQQEIPVSLYITNDTDLGSQIEMIF